MTERTLQTSTLTSKSGRQGKKSSQPRYVLLWEKIQSLRTRLEKQEATNKSILRQFSKNIRPLEESITTELIKLTKYLISGFHNEESTANRSLIGFWVIENFAKLAAFPFANSHEIETLYDEWRLPLQGPDDIIEAQLSLLMAGRNDLPGQSNSRSNYPDADMFATSNSTKSSGSKNGTAGQNPDPANHSNTTQTKINEQTEGTTTRSSRANKAEKSPKKTPKVKNTDEGDSLRSNSKNFEELFNIDKLFRRIARSVHPDREQDETKKAEKHAIMSDCLQARENEDIAQLLTLYANHVGELPDSWSDESTGELVIALEAQLRELENRSVALQTQDPVLQIILDRYLGYDTHDIDRRIQKHKDKLTDEINRLKDQRASLNTEEGWSKAMQERRDIELDKLVLNELTQ